MSTIVIEMDLSSQQNQELIDTPKKSRGAILTISLILIVNGFLIGFFGWYFYRSNQPEDRMITSQVPLPNLTQAVAFDGKVLFKSEIAYLTYKYVVYDLATNEAKYTNLPADLDTKLIVSPDQKKYVVSTESALLAGSTEDIDNFIPIYKLPERELSCRDCETISELDTIWSSDSTQLAFITNRNDSHVLHTINSSGENHTIVKIITTDKADRLEAYDAQKNELYYMSWENDAEDEIDFDQQHTEIFDTKTGALKRPFVFIDQKEILGDHTHYAPDMTYLYTGYARDNEPTQIIEYKPETEEQKTLYTLSQNNGYFYLSPFFDWAVVVESKQNEFEVVKIKLPQGVEEKLYNSDESEFIPGSISPDGKYIWTRSSGYAPKETYRIFDTINRRWLNIEQGENVVIKPAGLEKIYWLP